MTSFSFRTCALFLSLHVVTIESFLLFFFPFSYQPLSKCDECECNIRYCIFLLFCNFFYFLLFFSLLFLVKQAFVLGVHPLPRKRHEGFLHKHDNFSSLPSFIELRCKSRKRRSFDHPPSISYSSSYTTFCSYSYNFQKNL